MFDRFDAWNQRQAEKTNAIEPLGEVGPKWAHRLDGIPVLEWVAWPVILRAEHREKRRRKQQRQV